MDNNTILILTITDTKQRFYSSSPAGVAAGTVLDILIEMSITLDNQLSY